MTSQMTFPIKRFFLDKSLTFVNIIEETRATWGGVAVFFGPQECFKRQ